MPTRLDLLNRCFVLERALLSGLSVAVLGTGLGVESLHAQVQIQVVDAGGHPMPAARVDVYGKGELLAVSSAGRDGVASLPTERWGELRRISVAYLGFQTVIVQAAEVVPGLVVQMEPEALEVEGLDVEVRGGSLCPIDDSPEARRAWSDVASRYSTDTGFRPLLAEYLFSAGSVRNTHIHRVNESRLQRVTGSRRPQGPRASTGVLEARVARGGYSWKPQPMRFGRRDLHRTYPSLEMWDAYHFATTTFGALHDFSVIRSGAETTTLAFCPKPGSDGTGLMGTLEIVPETLLVSATWKFVVEDPDEDAGGHVDFVTHTMGPRQLPHLLARRGVFFRHNGREPPFPDLPRHYYREAIARVDWQVLRSGIQ